MPKVKVPPPATGIVYEGVTYPADENGMADVPDEAAEKIRTEEREARKAARAAGDDGDDSDDDESAAPRNRVQQQQHEREGKQERDASQRDPSTAPSPPRSAPPPKRE